MEYKGDVIYYKGTPLDDVVESATVDELKDLVREIAIEAARWGRMFWDKLEMDKMLEEFEGKIQK